MAKTLAEKFFIKPGYRVAVLNAPDGYLAGTLALPVGVTVVDTLDETCDLIQYFATHQETLIAEIDALKSGIKEGGTIWLCYPKGGDKAKLKTDLNRDRLWELLTPFGLTPNHQISIDETWSALRFKSAD
jgi:hypothetical protein